MSKILDRYRNRFDPKAEEKAVTDQQVAFVEDARVFLGTTAYKETKKAMRVAIESCRWKEGMSTEGTAHMMVRQTALADAESIILATERALQEMSDG